MDVSAWGICSEFHAVGRVFSPQFPHIIMVHSCTSQEFIGFSPIFLKPTFLQSFGKDHNKAWVAAVGGWEDLDYVWSMYTQYGVCMYTQGVCIHQEAV